MPKAPEIPTFDNIDDVQSKFHQTICYYENKVVLVKGANLRADNFGNPLMTKFDLVIAHYQAKNKTIGLEDPKFNYTEYNLGYANSGLYSIWWYRKPVKQYKQGLRPEQMGFSASIEIYDKIDPFGFHKSCVDMLENNYPDLNAIEKPLRDTAVNTIAFHKDFALSFDRIHEDFILEYKGNKIGASTNKSLSEFRLLSEYKHLAEALQEATG